MNLDQMSQKVRVRLGAPSTDSFFGGERLTDLVNQALSYVDLIYDWPWLLATETVPTVAGTSALSVTSARLKTRSLRLTVATGDIREIREGAIEDIDEYIDQPSQPPVVWADWGGQLLLAPIPDAVYSVSHRYTTAPAALSAGTDTPASPTWVHDLYVDYAVHMGFLAEDDAKRAAMALDAFTRRLQSVRDNRRRGQGTIIPRQRPWG